MQSYNIIITLSNILQEELPPNKIVDKDEMLHGSKMMSHVKIVIHLSLLKGYNKSDTVKKYQVCTPPSFGSNINTQEKRSHDNDTIKEPVNQPQQYTRDVPPINIHV